MVGRKPEFDHEAVLNNAMATFWEHGYEAASMADLLNATGLSKSSLYAGFGGKHDLFVESYDLYRRKRADLLKRTMEDTPAPGGIRAFFEDIITGGTDDLQRFGCMTTNQAAELAAQDDMVSSRVQEDYQLLEDAFAEHIKSGQQNGTVPAGVDALATASALVTAFSGFQLAVRANMDRARLRRALEYFMAPLQRP